MDVNVFIKNWIDELRSLVNTGVKAGKRKPTIAIVCLDSKADEEFIKTCKDIGFVGEIDKVDPKVLFDLIDNEYLPVIAPVGFDDNFDTYNINADDAACAIAKAVGADKLAFLTDIEGVYKDINDPSSFLSRLTCSEADALIAGGNIGGGMLPKLNNCTDAIRQGVNSVHILDGRIAHCLLLEIFTNKGVGTMFTAD